MSSGGHLPPDITRGPQMLGAVWFLGTFSIIIVGVRIYCSAWIQRHVGLSDIFMIIAMIFGIVNGGVITAGEKWGLGHHSFHLRPLQVLYALKYQTIGEILGILSPIFGRVAVAIYLLGLVGSQRTKRYLLHGCMWSIVIVNIATIIVILAQCPNTESIWNSHVPGKCWSKVVQSKFGYFQGAINTSVDLILIVLPALVLYQLFPTLSTKKRASCIALLSIASLATISSGIKTWRVDAISAGGDIVYNIIPFVCWSAVENNVIMIVGSIPIIYQGLFAKRESVDKSYALQWYRVNPKTQGYVKDEREMFASKGEMFAGKGDGLEKETGVVIETRRIEEDEPVQKKRGAAVGSVVKNAVVSMKGALSRKREDRIV